jgi:hypothetical protein
MRAQGWYRDPFKSHEDRWFSDGRPTALVRDGGLESESLPPAQEWSGPLTTVTAFEPSNADDLKTVSSRAAPGDPQRGPAPTGFGVIAVDAQERPGPLGTNRLYWPRIRIDGGEPMRAVWGVSRIPVPAGHHHVEVSVKLAVGRGGRADTTVLVPPGQTILVEYQPPIAQIGNGSLRVNHPITGVALGPSPRKPSAARRALGLVYVLVGVTGAVAAIWFGAHRR